MKLVTRFSALIGLLLMIAVVPNASAQNPYAPAKSWGASAGADLAFQGMGHDIGTAKTAFMLGLTLEGLFGYRPMDNWLFGLDLDLGRDFQISRIGQGRYNGFVWHLGPGVQHRINDQWSVQGALHLLANHGLGSSGSLASLNNPWGLRFKAQYFLECLQSISPLSVDGGFGLDSYQFKISGNDTGVKVNRWYFMAGMTYHFGALFQSGAASAVAAAPSAPLEEQKQLSDVIATQKVDGKQQLSLPSSAFNPNSTVLEPSMKSKIIQAGEILSKNPPKQVLVRGYADTSGNAQKNIQLSEARAQAVKAALVEGGLSQDVISAQGMGSQNPIADNKTAEGRSKNRRVEISIEGGSSQ